MLHEIGLKFQILNVYRNSFYSENTQLVVHNCVILALGRLW